MIKQLFIKDYKNVNDVNVRNKYGMVSGIFGIITNLFLFIIKLVIGLLSNSVTIVADAFNNLADSGSCILTILGFKLANKPADKEHPYGHARYEYIAGIIIALIILSTGVLFAKTSIEKIINPEEISITLATYIVLIVAILGKVWQMLTYLNFSKSINSQTIKATALDARNDILTTTAVLISVLIMQIFKINIDAYMGLIVSIFIIISAIGMVKKTIEPLLGIVPTKEQVDTIRNKILSYEGVKGIHDLLIHNYGAGNDFVTVHAEVSSNMNILSAHNLMDVIERDFKENLGIHLTIHVDPLELDDEKTKKVQEKVQEILNDFDKELNIHDFRIVPAKHHTNVIFDIIVPFEKNYTEEQIFKLLTQNFKNEETKYYFILNIDRPFC